jgi:F-type H+-transporting ATPase subunit delta
VVLVLTKRNFLSFREIYQQYREMALESQGRIIVDVSSPFPLTDDQRQTLTEALRQKLGKTAVLEERVDRTLVGGMVVRAGDEVWDGSLRERLRRLENALKA